MKTNERKDLQTKPVEELIKLLKEAKEALMAAKLAHQQNKLQNTRELFNLRKKIATILTIMNMKKVTVEKASVEAVVEKKVKVTKKAKEAKEEKGGKE